MIDRDELRRLCTQEPRLTYQQIAAHLGVSRQRIHLLAKQMGLASTRPARPIRPTRVCPDCGGPKGHNSACCHQCHGLRGRGGHNFVDSRGYTRLPRYLQKRYGLRMEHQLVAMQTISRPLRDGEEVHHIDGNPLNNHPDNLMVVTRSEHMLLDGRMSRNRRSLPTGPREYKGRPNKTGYHGVYKARNDRYRAVFSVGCYWKSLGTYDTAEEAAVAYDAAAVKYHGEFAIVNQGA